MYYIIYIYIYYTNVSETQEWPSTIITTLSWGCRDRYLFSATLKVAIPDLRFVLPATRFSATWIYHNLPTKMVLFHSEISFLEALHDATTQCPAKMVTPSTLPARPHFAATMRGQTRVVSWAFSHARPGWLKRQTRWFNGLNYTKCIVPSYRKPPTDWHCSGQPPPFVRRAYPPVVRRGE